MIKKYVMIIAVLLVILMFTSTSTASVGFYEERYELLQEKFQNPVIRNIFDKLSQVILNSGGDGVSDDADEDDDENDGEYDDGEHDDDDSDDGPEEDVLLPKIWVLDGEKTPYEGNYTDEGDGGNTTNTIDHPGGDGVVIWGNGTVDSDGDEGAASNETTIPDYIDDGEWTVKLDRFVEIVTERNVKLGGMLKRVVERIFAPGTTESDGTTAENDVVGVVVEGESVGTPGADNADVVVLTDDG